MDGIEIFFYSPLPVDFVTGQELCNLSWLEITQRIGISPTIVYIIRPCVERLQHRTYSTSVYKERGKFDKLYFGPIGWRQGEVISASYIKPARVSHEHEGRPARRTYHIDCTSGGPCYSRVSTLCTFRRHGHNEPSFRLLARAESQFAQQTLAGGYFLQHGLKFGTFFIKDRGGVELSALTPITSICRAVVLWSALCFIRSESPASKDSYICGNLFR